MLITAVMTCVATAFAVASWYLLHHKRVDARVWSIAAALLLWSVGLGVKLTDNDLEHAEPDRAASPIAALPIESLAWTGDEPRAPTATSIGSAGPPSAAMEAAPIASLIGGLEARLVTNPDDAGGWALLAQSYAFMGKMEAAEQALSRATELGMDEQALRERIAAAAERTQHGNWIQQAIGG